MFWRGRGGEVFLLRQVQRIRTVRQLSVQRLLAHVRGEALGFAAVGEEEYLVKRGGWRSHSRRPVVAPRDEPRHMEVAIYDCRRLDYR
jgi:hypothetical protein